MTQWNDWLINEKDKKYQGNHSPAFIFWLLGLRSLEICLLKGNTHTQRSTLLELEWDCITVCVRHFTIVLLACWQASQPLVWKCVMTSLNCLQLTAGSCSLGYTVSKLLLLIGWLVLTCSVQPPGLPVMRSLLYLPLDLLYDEKSRGLPTCPILLKLVKQCNLTDQQIAHEINNKELNILFCVGTSTYWWRTTELNTSGYVDKLL